MLNKTQKTVFLQSAADIEYILNWEQSKHKVNQKSLFIELSEDEKLIANILQNQDKPIIDDICKNTQLTMSKVSSLLLEMEFKGAVRSLPGKIYELTGSINNL